MSIAQALFTAEANIEGAIVVSSDLGNVTMLGISLVVTVGKNSVV